MVAALAAVLLWLAPALPALAASARLDGLPLLQRFGQGQLPGAPSYSAAGVDSEGTLYVGSSDGVMVYRSGDWELVALPRRTGVYSLLVAPGDRVFVAGVGVFGRLHQLPDGRFRFEDLIGRLGAIPPGVRGHAFYDLVEAAGDVYVRNDATLFRIGPDGSLWRTPLPDGLGSRLFSAGGRLYGMLAGAGLCRLVDGRFEPVRGGEALADVGVAGVWPHRDGLLSPPGRASTGWTQAGCTAWACRPMRCCSATARIPARACATARWRSAPTTAVCSTCPPTWPMAGSTRWAGTWRSTSPPIRRAGCGW